MAQKGHLECYFFCGVWCSSLESLALHIDVDHREDDESSPFVVREVSPGPQLPPPPRPSRLPPPIPGGGQQDPSSAHLPVGGAHQKSSVQDHEQLPSTGSNDTDVDLSFICAEPGCGEQVLIMELNEHTDMHEAERLTLDDTSPQKDLMRQPDRHRSSIPSDSSAYNSNMQNFSTTISPALRHDDDGFASRDDRPRQGMRRKFLSMLGIEKSRPDKIVKDGVRLGKSELGPHAYEDQMPEWLYKQLQKGPKVTRYKYVSRNGGTTVKETVEGETCGALPIIRRLIENDGRSYMAYLCHPSVKQIGKDKNEGGFCGYRNIQMQISYLQGSKAPGSEHFPGRTPGILDLQELIESAWDNDIHWYSRAQIGRLKGTRKWIGTLEAHAIYQYLGIPCVVHQFSDTKDQYAYERLLDWVEAYFKDGALDDNAKVQTTLKPPIYFQRPGHSLTIVGWERRKNGVRNLILFDPMYRAPKAMEQFVQRGPHYVRHSNDELMRFYRRSEFKLEHYVDFEVLELAGDNLPIFPAWDVLNRFVTCPFVYAFFDISSCSYEVYPQEMFHQQFPWFHLGNLFDIREARFHCAGLNNVIVNTLIPSACVPQLWSRRVVTYSGWGATQRLMYDDWIMSDDWKEFGHTFWDTLTSVQHSRAWQTDNSTGHSYPENALNLEPLAQDIGYDFRFDAEAKSPGHKPKVGSTSLQYYPQSSKTYFSAAPEPYYPLSPQVHSQSSPEPLYMSSPIPFYPLSPSSEHHDQNSARFPSIPGTLSNDEGYCTRFKFQPTAPAFRPAIETDPQYPSPLFAQAIELETLCRNAGMTSEEFETFAAPLGYDFGTLCMIADIHPELLKRMSIRDWHDDISHYII